MPLKATVGFLIKSRLGQGEGSLARRLIVSQELFRLSAFIGNIKQSGVIGKCSKLDISVKSDIGKFSLRDTLKEKTGLCGENSHTAEPHSVHSVSKRIYGLFCILGHKEHFWSSQKNLQNRH